MTTSLSDVTRSCGRCKGEGRTHNQWAKDTGREGPRGRLCSFCGGAGNITGFDPVEILNLCLSRADARGQKRMLKSFPHKRLRPYDTRQGARAYYVWRIARFHGGIDPKMPMNAEMLCQHDPFREELDRLANFLAEKVFGTSRAGALRWARAMGI